jgi:anti-sigma regulatory factor (Ser/Thr protein kinase)
MLGPVTLVKALDADAPAVSRWSAWPHAAIVQMIAGTAAMAIAANGASPPRRAVLADSGIARYYPAQGQVALSEPRHCGFGFAWAGTEDRRRQDAEIELEAVGLAPRTRDAAGDVPQVKRSSLSWVMYNDAKLGCGAIDRLRRPASGQESDRYPMFDRQELQLGLAPNVAAASQGRSAVRALLGEAPQSFTNDAMLATSELITNGLVHGYGMLELSARFDRERGWLRVEVSDSSSELPHVVERAPNEVGGLGLRIVAELSSAWGSFRNERGKTVWFEVLESPETGDAPSWR